MDGSPTECSHGDRELACTSFRRPSELNTFPSKHLISESSRRIVIASLADRRVEDYRSSERGSFPPLHKALERLENA